MRGIATINTLKVASNTTLMGMATLSGAQVQQLLDVTFLTNAVGANITANANSSTPTVVTGYGHFQNPPSLFVSTTSHEALLDPRIYGTGNLVVPRRTHDASIRDDVMYITGSITTLLPWSQGARNTYGTQLRHDMVGRMIMFDKTDTCHNGILGVTIANSIRHVYGVIGDVTSTRCGAVQNADGGFWRGAQSADAFGRRTVGHEDDERTVYQLDKSYNADRVHIPRHRRFDEYCVVHTSGPAIVQQDGTYVVGEFVSCTLQGLACRNDMDGQWMCIRIIDAKTIEIAL